MPGTPDLQSRRGRTLEYALVILTIATVVVLAGWFIGSEIAAGITIR